MFPNGKAYPKPEDDRFWAAAIDMKMPLTVHVGFDRLGPRASQPTFEYPGADPEVLKKLGPRKIVEWVALPFLSIPPSMSLAQLGAVRRLRSPARAEDLLRGDAAGLGAVLDGGGRLLVRAAPPLGASACSASSRSKQRPSEYVRQHISFSVQHVERVAVELRHHMGVEHIMFATDFPHIECDWPNTRPFAERLFAGVPADEAFKIAAGNMLAFFHLRGHADGREGAGGARRDDAALRPQPVRLAARSTAFAADVRRAEALGWDAALQPDSQLRRRDTYVLLAAAARATERIVLGPLLANPVNRHPDRHRVVHRDHRRAGARAARCSAGAWATPRCGWPGCGRRASRSWRTARG